MKLDVKLYSTGYCTQQSGMVFPNEKWQKVSFQALFACIKHPTKGVILFDTGYAPHYFEASKHLPYKLYSMAVPVFSQENESAKLKLIEDDISAEDVKYIIISHFHADHISGLRDFPNAKFICFRSAYEAVKGTFGFNAVRKAFLPYLLAEDFEERCVFLEDASSDSNELYSVDVFEDGSLEAFDLSGHAMGQLGLKLATMKDELFFVADAVWHSRALRENVLPSQLSRIAMADWQLYKANFEKLRQWSMANPEVCILPTHCSEVFENYVLSDATL